MQVMRVGDFVHELLLFNSFFLYKMMDDFFGVELDDQESEEGWGVSYHSILLEILFQVRKQRLKCNIGSLPMYLFYVPNTRDSKLIVRLV